MAKIYVGSTTAHIWERKQTRLRQQIQGWLQLTDQPTTVETTKALPNEPGANPGHWYCVMKYAFCYLFFFFLFSPLLYSPTSGCFSSFCNPPNSDRDYQILNVLAWSFLSVRIHTGVGHTSNSESAQHFWLWIIMFLLWWDLNLRMWSPTLYQ